MGGLRYCHSGDLMEYRVLNTFRDLTDGHLYQVGDRFPHDGREIDQKRIESLIDGRNQANMRLIEATGEIVRAEDKSAKTPVKRRKTKTE